MRILVDEASKIERAEHLKARPYERSEHRAGYANGFKPKTVMTRLGDNLSLGKNKDTNQFV